VINLASKQASKDFGEAGTSTSTSTRATLQDPENLAAHPPDPRLLRWLEQMPL